MHFQNKYTLSLLALLAFTACRKGEKPITPIDRGNVITNQLDMSSDYRNQVFFSLGDNKIVSTNLKTSWDLAFESAANDFHIRLNTSKSMHVFKTSEISLPNVSDTTGISVHAAYDAPSGNADSTAIGNWQSNTDVYIIDRGFSNTGTQLGYRKIKFMSATASGFVIQYANMDGSGLQTITVLKNSQTNYTCFSFDQNTVVTAEPSKGSYDLLFSQYTHLYTNPFMPYLVSGVLINPNNVKVAQVFDVPFTDIRLADTLSHPFAARTNMIGYDWKTYSLQASVYTTDASKCYLIKDVKGFIYKLHFIDFYSPSGIKGAPKFEFKKM